MSHWTSQVIRPHESLDLTSHWTYESLDLTSHWTSLVTGPHQSLDL